MRLCCGQSSVVCRLYSPDGAKLAVGHSGDSVVTIITGAERFAAQQAARRGQSTNGNQFLTPGNVYIDTIPGYALVWEISAE